MVLFIFDKKETSQTSSSCSGSPISVDPTRSHAKGHCLSFFLHLGLDFSDLDFQNSFPSLPLLKSSTIVRFQLCNIVRPSAATEGQKRVTHTSQFNLQDSHKERKIRPSVVA